MRKNSARTKCILCNSNSRLKVRLLNPRDQLYSQIIKIIKLDN